MDDAFSVSVGVVKSSVKMRQYIAQRTQRDVVVCPVEFIIIFGEGKVPVVGVLSPAQRNIVIPPIFGAA